MTPGAALRTLAAQGRIAAPWLPGMLFSHPITRNCASSFRVLGTAARRVTGWDGLHPTQYTLRDDGWVVEVSVDGSWDFEPITQHAAPRDWEPVLEDVATAGGLLALLREASGQPRIAPGVSAAEWSDAEMRCPVRWRWRLYGWLNDRMFLLDVEAPTEGAAIAAALVALAGAP